MKAQTKNLFSKSKIFLILCLAFVSGIGIASFKTLSTLIPVSLLVFGIILSCVFYKGEEIFLVVGLTLIVFSIGILLFQNTEPKNNPQNLFYYNDQEVVLRGRITKDLDKREKNTNIEVMATSVKVNQDLKQVKGKVLLTVPFRPEYYYGDEIEVKGKLSSPKKFDNFDYPGYLSRFGIHSIMYNPEIAKTGEGGSLVYKTTLSLKHKLRDTFKKILPEPHSSIICAMLLGEKGEISPSVRNNFSFSGVSHILAISGLHITIISFVLIYFFLGLGLWRKTAVYATFLVLIFYLLLIGAPTSAVRASIMGLLVMVAFLLGRLPYATNATLATASTMLLFNPRLLRYDIGFQLSFLAVLGIIYFFPILERLTKSFPNPFKIKTLLLITLSAQITTIPLIFFHFKIVSLVAPITNLLILPLLPLILVFGIMAGSLGVIFLPLGKMVGYGLWFLVSFVLKVTEIFASISWGALEASGISFFWILGYYIILTAFYFWLKERLKLESGFSR